MTWVKLDDQFFRNPKVRAAGKDGRELYIAGLCHCAAQLTDGLIDKAIVPVLAAEAEVKPSAAARLVTVGLWSDEGDTYEVHDYLAWNPSAEAVHARRAQRAEAGKRGGKRSGESRRSKPEANASANGQRNGSTDSSGNEADANPGPGPGPGPGVQVSPPSESTPFGGAALSLGRIADLAEQYQWPESFMVHEYEKFGEHSEAHGLTYVSVDAGFRKWLSNARPPKARAS